MLLGGALFLVGGILMLLDEDHENKWVPYVGIPMSIVAIAFGLKLLFDKTPQFIINEEGIWDKKTKLGMVIPWELITGVEIVTIHNNKNLNFAIDLNAQHPLLELKQFKSMHKGNSMIGLNSIFIQIGTLNAKAKHIETTIAAILEAPADKRAIVIRESVLYTGRK